MRSFATSQQRLHSRLCGRNQMSQAVSDNANPRRSSRERNHYGRGHSAASGLWGAASPPDSHGTLGHYQRCLNTSQFICPPRQRAAILYTAALEKRNKDQPTRLTVDFDTAEDSLMPLTPVEHVKQGSLHATCGCYIVCTWG